MDGSIYELNKKRAAAYSWIEFLQSKMPELKAEYNSRRKSAATETQK
jgi:hypothetical protein